MSNISRRDVIAGAALALAGTTIISSPTAAAQTPDGAQTPAGDPKQGSAIKTRTASFSPLLYQLSYLAMLGAAY